MALLMPIYACEVGGDAVYYDFEEDVVVLFVRVADVFVAYMRTIYVQLNRTVRYDTVRYGTGASATSLRLKTKNRVNVDQKSITPSKII
jgi:hypothetical protein